MKAPVRTLPVHSFDGSRYGPCMAKVRDTSGRLAVCKRLVASPVHRYYPCRAVGCVDEVRWRSIEARDRHEATIHGDGW